jgi:predicted naringenin-chalcone synthase
MKCAKSIAAENPRNRVLMVCTELCTLHMQLNDAIDNLIASALFSDGSGAMVIGAEPRKYGPSHTSSSSSSSSYSSSSSSSSTIQHEVKQGKQQQQKTKSSTSISTSGTTALKRRDEQVLFELHKTASFIIPNTLEMMKWELHNTGLVIGLAKEITGEIYKYIDNFCRDLLSHHPDVYGPITPPMCQWAVHPGGPMIIQAIADKIGIEKAAVQASWDVLDKYGNMSSATLIFVLQQIREQKLNGVWVPALAFGPGLNVEGTLLRTPTAV